MLEVQPVEVQPGPQFRKLLGELAGSSYKASVNTVLEQVASQVVHPDDKCSILRGI